MSGESSLATGLRRAKEGRAGVTSGLPCEYSNRNTSATCGDFCSLRLVSDEPVLVAEQRLVEGLGKVAPGSVAGLFVETLGIHQEIEIAPQNFGAVRQLF